MVGSKIPMEIWTVDVFNYDIDNFLEPIVGENGVQKLADWGTHEHFRKMQRKKGITGWLDAFKAGVDRYIAGDFAAARAALTSNSSGASERAGCAARAASRRPNRATCCPSARLRGRRRGCSSRSSSGATAGSPSTGRGCGATRPQTAGTARSAAQRVVDSMLQDLRRSLRVLSEVLPEECCCR